MFRTEGESKSAKRTTTFIKFAQNNTSGLQGWLAQFAGWLVALGQQIVRAGALGRNVGMHGHREMARNNCRGVEDMGRSGTARRGATPQGLG